MSVKYCYVIAFFFKENILVQSLLSTIFSCSLFYVPYLVSIMLFSFYYISFLLSFQRNGQHMIHKTKKTNKKTTQHVLDTTMRKNTNNVNKTWALLKTTGGRDEPKIVFMHIVSNVALLSLLSIMLFCSLYRVPYLLSIKLFSFHFCRQ